MWFLLSSLNKSNKKIIAIVFVLFICSIFSSVVAFANVKPKEENKKQVKYSYSLYRLNNVYDPDSAIYKKSENVNYGTIVKDLKYFSPEANDYKYCNVLLPAGYSKNKTYPVLYVIHGWHGNHSNQIDDDSYLQILYGNMLDLGRAKPMIIVNVDMYTDKISEKEEITKDDVKLKASYAKISDDIVHNVMPLIEKTYPVKTGRNNTAIAGVSHGGTNALIAAFKYTDKFAYVASFAPDPGVIPTEFRKDTYVNSPVLDDFRILNIVEQFKYLYLAVGGDDPENIDPTLYYGEVLKLKGIKNRTDFVEGMPHDPSFWRLCFNNYLNKLFRD